jgi:membrane-associated protease RseP (regulator of RpoE activity)
MSGTLGVVAFVATLMTMILFHEAGHFATAKRFGMKVEEFYFGLFGPKLVSVRRGETTYGVKAVLLGGYVKIAGMNPFNPVPEEEKSRTFGAKPAWQRAIVLLAGSSMHLVMATVLLALLFGAVGIPKATTTLDSVDQKIEGVSSPAAAAGFAHGDRIVSIDGVKTSEWNRVRNYIRAHPDKQVAVALDRRGRVSTIFVTLARVTVTEDGTKKTIGILGVSPKLIDETQSPPAALWSGMKTTGELIGVSVGGIGQIFSFHGIEKVFSALGGTGARTVGEPVGPIGGARVAGEAAAAGELGSLLLFLAGFIVFVGVINLLPLPPLDGGHLLILVIEKIRRRKVDMRKVVPVSAVVVSFFVLLTIALLYLDVTRPVANPFQ